MRSKKYKKVYDENGDPKKDVNTAAGAGKDAEAASGNAGAAGDRAQAQTDSAGAGTADTAAKAGNADADVNAAKAGSAAQDNIKSAGPSDSKKKKHGRHRKKMKTWKKVVCLVLALVLATAGTGYMAMKDYLKTQLQSMKRTSVDEKKLSIVDVNGYANIVLLGVDSRSMKKKDLKNTNTDCIVIVSIEQKTGKVNLISVFRDTYLKMGDTTTYAKINSAFAYGGAAMTMKSLNQAMDLNVRNYVLFNFKMVANVVDKVGGITVNVKQEEIYQLNKYTAETARIIGQKKYKLVRKAGKQKLTGVQAVSYGRIRKGVGDDFKRTNRMRVVIQKVTAKLKKCSISELTSIMKLCRSRCRS
jgi:LCP family protein required for cell wall assembly